HVPISRDGDVTITICPKSSGIYALSPFPFAADGAEFAFAGRFVFPGQHEREGGWAGVLAKAPTQWETFQLVAG
ncbi:MAG TPA: hypothetical protein VFI48_15455, partial [Hyphomicrobiaceae bacterium]|nr:hypothetical protein [Hyphomicrobiaceae bacterium]